MTEEIKHKVEDVRFLRLILAANDEDFKMWPKNNVNYAKRVCIKNWQYVPSLDTAIRELGLELSKSIYTEIKQDRLFKNALIGHGSPCHYCGSELELGGFEFALMRVTNNKRNWNGTIASIALSTITLPLIGGATLKLPTKSLNGAAHLLKLVACKSCMQRNSNILGLFIPNEERASHHPLWKPLYEAGFTRLFLDGKIPFELKTDGDF